MTRATTAPIDETPTGRRLQPWADVARRDELARQLRRRPRRSARAPRTPIIRRYL